MARPRKNKEAEKVQEVDIPDEEIQTKDTPKESAKGHFIIQQCRDCDNFDKIYQIGENVSHWDKDRIENGIKIGAVSDK